MELCCCRWSLRIGALLWAWLSLLIGLLGITACGVALSKWDTHRENIAERFPNSPKVPDFTLGIVITFLAFQVARSLFSSLLLVGIYKDIQKLILPFLIFTIFSVLHTLTTLLTTVDLSVTFPAVVTLNLLGSLAFIGIDIYCGLVVRSFYKELKRRKRKERDDCTFEEVDDDETDE